jgi:hypothetical protein
MLQRDANNMLQIVNGRIVKRRCRFIGDELVIGPEHAPARARRYAHKALCALPSHVTSADDREDRCAGLAIALISELSQLPRADADVFVESLPRAYAELITSYDQGKQLQARQARCA